MKAILCTVLAVFILLASTWARAETIYLRDGSRMAGKVVGATDDEIRFETPNGVLVIKRDQIERIEYDQASPSHDSLEKARADSTTTPSVAKKSIAESVIAERPSTHAATNLLKKRPVCVLGVGYRFATGESEGGLQGSLGLLAPVSNSFLVGGGFGFAHFNNKVTTLSKGTVTIIPVTAQIELRDLSGLALSVGIGYAIASHSLDPAVESLLASNGIAYEEKLKSTPTAEASLGFATRTSDTTKFGVSIGYQFLEPKVEATGVDLTSGASASVTAKVSLSAPFILAHLDF